ncbi:Stealth protein CR4, conserved region 4 [Pedococcus cremeus]|uniref:Stealth protein CR4, conserved region 4 n=1 Tax=Pedococcus cremeus TaxID=587636 RepID=A0A1H9W4D8_9MICO|nr:stealth family protein [Pedococcus cremeus]SES28567.1 Stealth protein CR4, conserved region 4 [Pedococcus cremeus]
MRKVVDAVPVSLRRQVRKALPAPVWQQLRAAAYGQTRVHHAWRKSRVTMLRMGSGRLSDGTVALELQGEPYIAQKVSHFRSSEVLARHLSMVADAFEAHDVPYFVLDAEPERRRIVVVSRKHRGRALEVLGKELRGGPTYIAPVKDRKTRNPRLVGRSPLPRRADVVCVFQVLASESGGYLGGPELGCDLEFWRETSHSEPAAFNGEPVPAGSLVMPRRNRWADVITPSARKTVLRPVDGTPRPMLETIDHPHLFQVTEPIDVVYTWVDGSDPDWILRKAEAQNEHLSRSAVMHALAANDSRFVSRDELRYSLRSLDMYADWVRHVYLVTDDQVPAWLDTTNPRVTVVSHRELFGDRGRLPTFNSHAIESQLHRIPGLSEHYLYLNDDVFFGRPVSPDLFFHSNGLSKFFVSHAKVGLGPAAPEDMPVMSAAKNNRDLIVKMFDRALSNKFKHVPHPQRRSVLRDMEQDFAADFERTAASQFRSHDDVSISAALAHYYSYATGRAVPGGIRYFYADIAREDTPLRLKSLLSTRDFDVFCLNDHDSSRIDVATQAKIIGDFLSAYFPQPSSFEKPPA